jgi:hypothetical protein
MRPQTSFRLIDLDTCLASLFYLVISLLFFGLPVLGHLTDHYLGIGADPTVFIWDLAWWPYSIAHGLNPIIASVIWAPQGHNLAWTTSIPGPSLLMAPVTYFLGPIVSFNVLILLCPIANSLSAFALCKYVGRNRFWPALLGGYLFGFSQYAIAQALSHLFLLFIFPVPLAVLFVLRRMQQQIGRNAFVALLTAVLAFEFLSSTELFATTTIFGGLAILLSYWFFGIEIRRALERVSLELGIVYALLLVILSPYLYYVFAKGVPAPFHDSTLFSSTPTTLFLPSNVLLVKGSATGFVQAMMAGQNWFELSGYLGPGLWLMIALFAISHWRKPVAKLLLLNLVIIAILSMGPSVTLYNGTLIPMPWWIFDRLPLTNQVLPVRFGMYLSLDAALIASIYLSEPDHSQWLKVAMALLAILFLIPAPSGFPVTSAFESEPEFFKSDQYKDYIARGDNVLLIPRGDQSMSLLWQAESGFYFKIAIGRTPPRSEEWPILRSLDSGDEIPNFNEQLEALLRAAQVKTIIVEKRAQLRWPAMLTTLQMTPVSVDGVLLFPVPPAILNSPSVLTRDEMARRDAQASFAMLLSAGSRYLQSGLPLEQLTPWKAQQLHMIDLPEGVVVQDQSNNWWQQLWLGPVDYASIGVGIYGRYEDLKELVPRYGPFAKGVQFPYGQALGHPGPEQLGQLFMVFDAAGASRAAAIDKPANHP